jgi:uncharacterized membrane protein
VLWKSRGKREAIGMSDSSHGDAGLDRATRPEEPLPSDAVTSRVPDAAPPQWHRGMTLLATISLFIGTRGAWTRAVAAHPPVAAVITACYAAILILGVLTLVVRRRRTLAWVDLGVLAVAIVLVLCGYVLAHAGTDEAALTARAAKEFLAGHPIYGRPWPSVFHGPIAVTKTMSGGADYTYAYPPFAVMLSAPFYAVLHSAAAVTLLATGALIAGTVLLWCLLPAPWRPAATAVCLGFGLLAGYARAGYPAIVSGALLIPVVIRWPATGAGGRLGRRGVLRAICLGAACAAQQLPWFLAPFLIVGIYLVRRGELGHRPALAVVARYTGVAVLTWLLINAYFIIQAPKAWLSGLLLPFTQGAILHGQGAMSISYYFTAGSDRLDFYSYGSMLLELGLLAAFVLFIKRLGPAATVLPWCAFYLATRSQDGYFLLMTPLWLAAVATVPASAFAGAWQPRVPRLRGRTARAALAAGLVAPALLCVAVAAAGDPPLRLTVSGIRTVAMTQRGITGITLKAINTTGTALKPNFAIRKGQAASAWWRISSGPTIIGPHATASYTLQAPGGLYTFTAKKPRIYLCAFTGTPMTISSVRLVLLR